MWQVFLTNVKMSFRNFSSVFWTLAFPVILAAMMMGMLSGVEKGHTVEAQPFAVVNDAAWQKVPSAGKMVGSISSAQSETKDGDQLIKAHTVTNRSQAMNRLDEHKDIGYIYMDGDGLIRMVLADRDAAEIQSGGNSAKGVTVSLLSAYMARLNQTGSTLKVVAQANPARLRDPNFLTGIQSGNRTYTTTIKLTHVEPTMTAPYYFAVLGMACMIGAGVTASLIASTQANLSKIGARFAVSPSPVWVRVGGAFLATWLFSCISLMVAYVFIRTVCGMGVGGRDPVALVALVLSTFMASSFGALLGALPRLSAEIKVGLNVFIDCTLSVFAGLYGPSTMDIDHSIQEKTPYLHYLNPVKQVSNLFYDIVYYDSFRPFVRTCLILVIMSAVFLAGAALLLRRQRYEHL